MQEVRPIDGNRLAELFDSAAERGAGVLAMVYRDAAHFARTAQAIEAEPVRRGRWIPVDGEPYAKCSYCGEKHYGCSTPYCDMCGTYMRKDGADNEHQV